MSAHSVHRPARGPAIPTRDDILTAAEAVIRDRGLTGATTREIARVAGCAEGSLYNHFDSKRHLLGCVVGERLAEFPSFARGFPDRAGTATVAGNLREFAALALVFLERLIPMIGTAAAEGERLAAGGDLSRRGPGPTLERLAAYLAAEQRRGRVHRDADVDGVAIALLGACHLHAMVSTTHGPDHLPFRDRDHFLDHLVAGLVAGLQER